MAHDVENADLLVLVVGRSDVESQSVFAFDSEGGIKLGQNDFGPPPLSNDHLFIYFLEMRQRFERGLVDEIMTGLGNSPPRLKDP